MFSSKRRKLESEDNTVKTTVFFIGQKPYKVDAFLPRLGNRVATKTIERALSEQGKALVPLPQGHFEIIRCSREGQIAVFKHSNVVGCRNTGSTQHGQIPLPLPRYKDINTFTREPENLRVGFEYLFGYSHQYTISQKGEIIIGQGLPPASLTKLTETERTCNMAKALEKHVSTSNVKISLSRNSSHFCPFSGGGDLHFFCGQSSLSAAVVTTAAESSEDEHEHGSPAAADSQNTPPKAQEIRCGSVENKVTGQQSEKEVLLQLQANMILTCATLLEEKLPTHSLPSIDYLVCYGVVLGPTYPLKLLKLTLDFVKQETLFEELFNLPPCPFYPVYIDIILRYLLHSIRE